MVDRLIGTEVNSRRIQNVEACFGSSGQPLAVPGRVLVGEGVLIKLCRKKPKQRQFFLFNDVLVYGNIVISKRKYNKQHIIPLECVQLDDILDDAEQQNGWLLKTRSKSFAVYAATAQEKREWMIHIQRSINDVLTKTGKRAPEENAPVWVPDNEVAACMLCHTKKFTLIERRLCFDELTTAQPNAPTGVNGSADSSGEEFSDDDEPNQTNASNFLRVAQQPTGRQ